MSEGSFYSSERGGMKMNFNGYSYNMDRSYNTHSTWRCIRSRWPKTERCLGRARSNGSQVSVLQDHNHSADLQTAEALRLKSVLYGEVEVPTGKIHLNPRKSLVKKEEMVSGDENNENQQPQTSSRSKRAQKRRSVKAQKLEEEDYGQENQSLSSNILNQLLEQSLQRRALANLDSNQKIDEMDNNGNEDAKENEVKNVLNVKHRSLSSLRANPKKSKLEIDEENY